MTVTTIKSGSDEQLSGTRKELSTDGSSTSFRGVLATHSRVIEVQHQTVDFHVDFEVFNQNLLDLLGRFNANDVAKAGSDLQDALARLQVAQGKYGLMLFGEGLDHGALFPLIESPARKSIRYHIGNPLIAIKMERKNMGVALYAPLTVLVYELSPGVVRVEYDLPSSMFGQFNDAEIDQVAAALNTKLYVVLLAAAGVSD